MKLPFGPYEPDQPDHMATGLKTISNAYPAANGYRPVGAFSASTTALPADCLGASSFVSSQGFSSVIAGTATALYKQLSGGWSSISSGYNLQGDNRWRFVQYGGLAIATDQVDAMVKIDLATSTVSLLGGAPPKVQTLAVVQNFLVGGIVDGNVSAIAWSGENNAEFWTYGSRKSDYNIFPDGGAITGLIGGEFGLVLQRNAVRRMSYVGGNVLFRLDKISSNDGCVTVHSVAQYGELAFWYSDNGFKMWDGAAIRPIGFEKVDATFAALYSVADWPRMSAAVDGQRSTVCWSLGTKIWLYNWRLEQWSIIDVAAQILFAGVTKTLSVDEQDPSVGANDDNADFTGLDSFDNARFQGGDPRFYLFSTARTLGTLSGANLAASFGMRNQEVAEGRDTRVNRVRPMTDATAGITLQMTARQRLGDAGETKTFTGLNASGEMPVRSRGRFIKPTMTIAASQTWTYAQGIDARAAAGGRR